MQERVEYKTNRIDLFTKKWLGSDSDEDRRNFIQWNGDWFRYSPTFWLPLGRLFWITEPTPPVGAVFGYGTIALSFPNHGHQILVAFPPNVED